ncbi:hypothetical protein BKA58DRAFT_391850 [Alternaria rosae]|uniref:uncharacterized protein n=1 Tax=Alternaria rosae TaxID=1187941 RepID=UPI001E8DAE81|nr:uncharacterized protein BKA58DRAFT_391850 [Alternaria rosae]KAH6860622.1 hypothetical protein BKA58DRAFT_391850 [Alternaria rosae]
MMYRFVNVFRAQVSSRLGALYLATRAKRLASHPRTCHNTLLVWPYRSQTIMRSHPIFLAHVACVASSAIPWHQQCWQQSPLYILSLQTSLDGSQDFASCSPSSHISDIQDEQQESPYAPWSHQPLCTPHLPGLNDTLCIYTDSAFSQGRGISIVTTPSLAQQFAALPAFLKPSALASSDINTPTNIYTATSIPGKGIGMLATRPLNFGDTVTSYTPAFIAYLESELSTLDREQLWRIAIEQLPEGLREGFLGLATVYGDERVKVQDVVKANTFQVLVRGRNHLAVWPETSRLNHACAPNAQYVIDTSLLTHTVRVTRPIAAGEEITISYTSPIEPTPERQQHLQAGFHFTCTCPRCTSPSSDATLSHIHSLQSQLNDWSPTSSASPAMAEGLLTIYRGEGLEGFMDVAYGFAALAHSAVGDAEKAVDFAKKAQEAILMKDGMWTENWKIWEELIGDVEAHWSWRRRL